MCACARIWLDNTKINANIPILMGCKLSIKAERRKCTRGTFASTFVEMLRFLMRARCSENRKCKWHQRLVAPAEFTNSHVHRQFYYWPARRIYSKYSFSLGRTNTATRSLVAQICSNVAHSRRQHMEKAPKEQYRFNKLFAMSGSDAADLGVNCPD